MYYFVVIYFPWKIIEENKKKIDKTKKIYTYNTSYPNKLLSHYLLKITIVTKHSFILSRTRYLDRTDRRGVRERVADTRVSESTLSGDSHGKWQRDRLWPTDLASSKFANERPQRRLEWLPHEYRNRMFQRISDDRREDSSYAFYLRCTQHSTKVSASRTLVFHVCQWSQSWRGRTTKREQDPHGGTPRTR